jgi:hypothetical protein
MTPDSRSDGEPGPPRFDAEVSLPAERSFVVQFRAGVAIGPDGPWEGRVEHVVSGRAAPFGDLPTLRAFFTQVLAGKGPTSVGN